MGGEFGQHLRRHRLAVQPLLQHVEGLHAALAHDQQFAVERAVEVDAPSSEVGEGCARCPRRCANRAAPRLPSPSARRPPARGCRPISIRRQSRPASSACKVRGLERVRQHRRAERRRVGAVERRCRAPSSQANSARRAAPARARPPRSRRRRARPVAASAVLASRAETPMRNAPVTSFSSAQRPVSSSASSQRASCAGRPRGRARRSVSTTSTASAAVRPAQQARATAARRSPPGRRHSRRTARTAPGRRGLHQQRGSASAWPGECEPAGHRGEAIAALGVGRGAQIVLISAAWRCGRARRPGGRAASAKAFTPAPPSVRPPPRRHSRRGRAAGPRCRAPHQCTSASVSPCVTHISAAPVSAMVAHRPSSRHGRRPPAAAPRRAGARGRAPASSPTRRRSPGRRSGAPLVLAAPAGR